MPEGLPSTQEELGRWLLQPETPQTLTEELLKWPLYPERTTQIFYPPYFFKGPRPIIVSAPSNVTYGTHFLVDVAEPKTVADVTWVRLGASTHGIDQSTRFNRLAFSETSTGLRVVTPSSPNLAPPGPYNLFVIDREGVPSEGVTLLVRGNAP